MTNKTSEAAERLRERLSLASYVMDKHSGAFDDHVNDLRTLAKAYLAEHLPDDDEPITEDWLTETYGQPANCWAGWRIGKFYIGHCFGWHLTRESPMVNVNNITTRGQLRLLLRVLNPERCERE